MMHGCIMGHCEGGIVIYDIASNQQKRIKVDNFQRGCLSPTKEHILGISMGRVCSYNLGTVAWQAMDDQSLHSIQPFLYKTPDFQPIKNAKFACSKDGSKFHCFYIESNLNLSLITYNIEGDYLFHYDIYHPHLWVTHLSWDYLVETIDLHPSLYFRVFDAHTGLLLFEKRQQNTSKFIHISNNRLAVYNFRESNVYTIEEERQQWEHGHQTIVVDDDSEGEEDDEKPGEKRKRKEESESSDDDVDFFDLFGGGNL